MAPSLACQGREICPISRASLRAACRSWCWMQKGFLNDGGRVPERASLARPNLTRARGRRQHRRTGVADEACPATAAAGGSGLRNAFAPGALCMTIHPGTVETPLPAPFSRLACARCSVRTRPPLAQAHAPAVRRSPAAGYDAISCKRCRRAPNTEVDTAAVVEEPIAFAGAQPADPVEDRGGAVVVPGRRAVGGPGSYGYWPVRPVLQISLVSPLLVSRRSLRS